MTLPLSEADPLTRVILQQEQDDVDLGQLAKNNADVMAFCRTQCERFIQAKEVITISLAQQNKSILSKVDPIIVERYIPFLRNFKKYVQSNQLPEGFLSKFILTI